jgi:hypothetical protein
MWSGCVAKQSLQHNIFFDGRTLSSEQNSSVGSPQNKQRPIIVLFSASTTSVVILLSKTNKVPLKCFPGFF